MRNSGHIAPKVTRTATRTRLSHGTATGSAGNAGARTLACRRRSNENEIPRSSSGRHASVLAPTSAGNATPDKSAI